MDLFFFSFFAVHPTASESICRCKGTYEGHDSAPLVTCSEGSLTYKQVKVKVSHSLIAVGAVGVRVPLYLGHS